MGLGTLGTVKSKTEIHFQPEGGTAGGVLHVDLFSGIAEFDDSVEGRHSLVGRKVTYGGVGVRLHPPAE